MKAIQVVFAVALAITCWACDENRITFTEPQPKGVKADREVRKEFVGNYFCEADSTFLIITPTRIVEKHVDDKGSENDGESKMDVQANFGKDSAASFKVKVKKDGEDDLDVEAEFSETHLDLTKGHIAKFFKGYYFLNVPAEEGSGFRVRLLHKSNDGLVIGRIESDSLLHLLENEGFVKKQTSEEEEEKWQLSPSRKQLKKLVDKGLFTEVRSYKKLKD
jgi:hypothetical protein